LSAAWLFLLPAAHAQNQPLNQTQIPPQGQSPSSTISDQKLSAAAAAMGQVTTIRQSYEQRIAQAPSSDKERLTDEANDALQKAVTDQGLSVHEYNTILQTAQNDPAIRQQLAQRIRHSD
jgi:predicted ATPase with chaperone activity